MECKNEFMKLIVNFYSKNFALKLQKIKEIKNDTESDSGNFT